MESNLKSYLLKTKIPKFQKKTLLFLTKIGIKFHNPVYFFQFKQEKGVFSETENYNT